MASGPEPGSIYSESRSIFLFFLLRVVFRCNSPHVMNVLPYLIFFLPRSLRVVCYNIHAGMEWKKMKEDRQQQQKKNNRQSAPWR